MRGGGRTSYNVDDRWVDGVIDGNIDFSRIQFLLTRARHFLIPSPIPIAAQYPADIQLNPNTTVVIQQIRQTSRRVDD